jgi:CubicO group peptidase (beta-lactamase class C family)
MKRFSMVCVVGLLTTVVVAGAASADGLDPATLERNARLAADYSAARNGVGVLVMVGGEIAFERYEPPHTAGTPNFLASGTKSFWGIAAAAMVEDGLLELDEPAAATLTEWKNDPRKSRITIRQLLDLSSGLGEDVMAIQGEGTAPDKFAYAVGLPAVTDPGETFRYGPSHFYAFGEIVKRKLASTGKDPLGYLVERIFEPIGLEIGSWVRDASGNPHIPNGAYLTARDWAKFGRLVLQRGMWEGKRIVGEELVAQCLNSSPANPGYGLAFWLNRPGGFSYRGRDTAPASIAGGFIYRDGVPDLAAALGAGRNGLYIIPSLDLVAVRQIPWQVRPAGMDWAEFTRMMRQRSAGFRDEVFLRLLLTGRETAKE